MEVVAALDIQVGLSNIKKQKGCDINKQREDVTVVTIVMRG
jgi:hypothetical protein